MPAPPARSFSGQCALWRKFKFQFARQELALELLVLSHVARNHLGDLARLKQFAQTKTVDTGVIGNDRQVFHTRRTQCIDQGLGYAAQTKAAHGQ